MSQWSAAPSLYLKAALQSPPVYQDFLVRQGLSPQAAHDFIASRAQGGSSGAAWKNFLGSTPVPPVMTTRVDTNPQAGQSMPVENLPLIMQPGAAGRLGVRPEDMQYFRKMADMWRQAAKNRYISDMDVQRHQAMGREMVQRGYDPGLINAMVSQMTARGYTPPPGGGASAAAGGPLNVTPEMRARQRRELPQSPPWAMPYEDFSPEGQKWIRQRGGGPGSMITPEGIINNIGRPAVPIGATPNPAWGSPYTDISNVLNRANEIESQMRNRPEGLLGLGLGQGNRLRSPVYVGPDPRDPVVQQQMLSGAMAARNDARAFTGYGNDPFGYRTFPSGQTIIVGPQRPVDEYKMQDKHLRAEAAVERGRQRRAGRPMRIAAAQERRVDEINAARAAAGLTPMTLEEVEQQKTVAQRERTDLAKKQMGRERARLQGRRDAVVDAAKSRRADRLAHLGDYVGAMDAMPEGKKDDPMALWAINPRLAIFRQRQIESEARQKGFDARNAAETIRANAALLQAETLRNQQRVSHLESIVKEGMAAGTPIDDLQPYIDELDRIKRAPVTSGGGVPVTSGGGIPGITPGGGRGQANRVQSQFQQDIAQAKQRRDLAAITDKVDALEYIRKHSGNDMMEAARMAQHSPVLTIAALKSLDRHYDPTQWPWYKILLGGSTKKAYKDHWLHGIYFGDKEKDYQEDWAARDEKEQQLSLLIKGLLSNLSQNDVSSLPVRN